MKLDNVDITLVFPCHVVTSLRIYLQSLNFFKGGSHYKNKVAAIK